MFRYAYIEKDIINHPRTLSIMEKLKFKELREIDAIEDIWGRVKKPYLQKRESLDVFIGKKKGQLVKEAPAAYGHGNEKHFYYIHAYNCIYECQYCYLQGHFNSPDLVLFINHDEIIQMMQETANQYPDCWFHAGEFSDSLALSHITNEWEEYFNFFEKNPQTKLEIRTKSVNIRPLLDLKPLPNTIISFSLASHKGAKDFDDKCPPIKHRLNAIKNCVEHGYPIGIHFDPIVYEKGFEKNYQDLIEELKDILPNESLRYISIGVVRFTKDVHHQVRQNYPDSHMLEDLFIKSFDGKIRYNRPMRNWILNKVRESLLPYYDDEKIYFCMED